MAVTAKLRCAEVTDYGSQRKVTLRPVSDTEGSNKSWSEATPAGECWLSITNPGAFEQFAPGKTFLVTFEESE